MGRPHKEFCIICNKGGEVVACADGCCPIAVHERCMDIPARSVNSGNFYCPYCLYRRSVAKSNRLKEHVFSRKQALHTFIDKGMIGGDKEVPSIASKSTCERVDEPLQEKNSDVSQSNCGQQLVIEHQVQSGPVVVSGSKLNDCTSCKAPEDDSIENGNVRVKNLQEVDEFQRGKSVEDHQQDGHTSGQQLVIQNQVQSGPVVVSGSTLNDPTSCKATEDDFIKNGNVQVENLQEVGEHQRGESVEDHQHDGHLSKCVCEEGKKGNEFFLEETERNSAEIAGDNMQKGVSKATAPSMNGDPSLQQHLKARGSAENGDSTCRESATVSTQPKGGKHVDRVRDGPMETVSPRRLTRASSSLLDSPNAGAKLPLAKRPSILLPVLPSGKRKRVLWRPEEEEMLEEGVTKFLTTTNKNIPWRKILEFGSHIFDNTRTPTDLKDKWKNLCHK